MTEKTYANKEITVVWKPDLCIHSAKCTADLSAVFDPDRRPWIDANAAATESIIQQVDQCPSKALTWRRNVTEASAGMAASAASLAAAEPAAQSVIVELQADGPLIVRGTHGLTHSDGKQASRSAHATAYCRCGASAHKPFCDGSHTRVGFKG